MRNINKSGKQNMVLWVGAIVLIAVLGFYMVSQNTLGGGDNTGSPSGFCDSTTSPTLNIKSVDRDSGTALTEGTNLYRIKGETSWNTFTAGTGFALNPQEEIEVVMGITTTDFTDNAYGQMFDYVVPCSETPSIEKEVANDEIETGLTATFYNADGDAGAETFVAGQTQDVSIKLQAGVKEYFGNPYVSGNPNVLVLALNSTEWDAPEKVYLRDGTELKRVDTPLRYSPSAGILAYAYELPVISDTLSEVVLKLNADDTTAPGTDSTAYIYAGSYFYNADTQEIEVGVENEEGTAVGTDSPDTVTLDFTA